MSLIRQTLSKPSWSIHSLLSSSAPEDSLPASQLHHLLRLAALPLPHSLAEQESMTTTIRQQLRFVRAVQRVNTDGVEPLRAIRDETRAAVRETTVSLEQVRDILSKEVRVGHYKRARRVKGDKGANKAEEWDVLGTASRRAGKYFIVESRT